jgi:LCP family protein required for cell wall assembly
VAPASRYRRRVVPGEDRTPDGGSLLARWREVEPDSLARGPAASRATLRHSAERARRRRRRRRVLAGLGVTVVVLIGAVAGYGEYLNHEIKRLSVHDLSGASTNGTENILLVGTTSRCVLAQQNPAFGLCSQGVTGVNSDVVMVLHLNPATKQVAILSIPRDLFVPNARTTGNNKIDAALYQGPTQLVDVIEQDFGIPIQHYVELNFDTFQGIVNALGGINMYFPMPLFDRESSLNIPTAGCHHLNGFEALAVVRARHLQYKPPGVTTSDHAYWPQDPESDLSRIRRDHEFIRVLAGQVARRGLGNPLTDRSLVAAVAPDLEVDSGLGVTQMINLVLTFHGVNPGSAPETTMPVLVHAGLSYYYDGYNYGSVELPSEPQDTQAVDQLLGLPAGRNTLTGAALPAPSTVEVTVVNGTGMYDQAAHTAAALAALGFQASAAGNAPSPGTVTETEVVYRAHDAAAHAAAEAVLQDLSGAVVMATGTPAGGAPVSVVTGTDFTVSAPQPASPGAGGTTPTTAAPTTTAPIGTSLSAPTPASQSLAPFDPRSCTASGGEGP